MFFWVESKLSWYRKGMCSPTIVTGHCRLPLSWCFKFPRHTMLWISILCRNAVPRWYRSSKSRTCFGYCGAWRAERQPCRSPIQTQINSPRSVQLRCLHGSKFSCSTTDLKTIAAYQTPPLTARKSLLLVQVGNFPEIFSAHIGMFMIFGVWFYVILMMFS